MAATESADSEENADEASEATEPTEAASEQWSYFTLFNAMADQALQLAIDDELVSDEKLPPGICSSAWPYAPGGHTLSLRWGDSKEERVEASLSGEVGDSEFLIAYYEYERNPDSGEILRVPTIRSLPVHADNNWGLTALSVCRAKQIEILVNGKKTTLQRLQPMSVPGWHGQDLNFHRLDRVWLSRHSFNEPGRFLCVVWDGADQKVQVLLQQIYR